MGKKNIDGKPENIFGTVLKTHYKAWKKADAEVPVGIETLKKHRDMINYPIQTRDDYRWEVMFNMLRHIARKLDDSKAHTYLQRIQDNILLSANRHLK